MTEPHPLLKAAVDKYRGATGLLPPIGPKPEPRRYVPFPGFEDDLLLYRPYDRAWAPVHIVGRHTWQDLGYYGNNAVYLHAVIDYRERLAINVGLLRPLGFSVRHDSIPYYPEWIGAYLSLDKELHAYNAPGLVKFYTFGVNVELRPGGRGWEPSRVTTY